MRGISWIHIHDIYIISILESWEVSIGYHIVWNYWKYFNIYEILVFVQYTVCLIVYRISHAGYIFHIKIDRCYICNIMTYKVRSDFSIWNYIWFLHGFRAQRTIVFMNVWIQQSPKDSLTCQKKICQWLYTEWE